MNLQKILKFLFVFSILSLLLILGSYFFNKTFIKAKIATKTTDIYIDNSPVVYFPEKKLNLNKPLLDPPQEVKALYVTAYYISSPERLFKILALLKKYNYNALVITLKDYYGRVFWDSKVKLAKEDKATDYLKLNLKDLVNQLHEKNVYLIARLVVFQDTLLAKARPDLAVKTKNGLSWHNRKGLYWVNPEKKDVWKYLTNLSEELIGYGFDEINFDYVRFPSDGSLGQIAYPRKKSKREVIKEFFNYLYDNFSHYNVKISLDLFGQSTVNYDDLGIGQVIEDARNFDFICPMVYPSHFARTFMGYNQPANHPYEVVKYTMVTAKKRLEKINARAKLRPWLQAFDLKVHYGKGMVQKQIQALKGVGSNNGYLLWDPRNTYRALSE